MHAETSASHLTDALIVDETAGLAGTRRQAWNVSVLFLFSSARSEPGGAGSRGKHRERCRLRHGCSATLATWRRGTQRGHQLARHACLRGRHCQSEQTYQDHQRRSCFAHKFFLNRVQRATMASRLCKERASGGKCLIATSIPEVRVEPFSVRVRKADGHT